jgi:hypothetical protein
MSIDKKILEELNRHNTINRYLIEQEEPTDIADEAGDDLELDMDVEGGAEEIAEPVDVDTDPEVEKIDDEGNVESDKDTDKLFYFFCR